MNKMLGQDKNYLVLTIKFLSMWFLVFAKTDSWERSWGKPVFIICSFLHITVIWMRVKFKELAKVKGFSF